jgi:hypothetical protein
MNYELSSVASKGEPEVRSKALPLRLNPNTISRGKGKAETDMEDARIMSEGYPNRRLLTCFMGKGA